jgi:hypothetical protein
MSAMRSVVRVSQVAILVAVIIWAKPARADENAPEQPPIWWDDPQEAGLTVQSGWNFNDNNNPDQDKRPDWCDEPPYVLPGGEAEPVDMGGSHDRGLGIPANDDGRTALVWFRVDNQYASSLVKELWLQYDLYKSGPVATGLVIEPEVPAGEPTPQVTDHKFQRLPKDLGNGWTRYTVRKWITPQPASEWIKFEFTTIEGHTGSMVIDNVWIGTHCELLGDQNHCEGYGFDDPVLPPDPGFYRAPSWSSGTEWDFYGGYPPQWMSTVGDHDGVIGIPLGAPLSGEIAITIDDKFDPNEPRPAFYQYDRYTGGGLIFSDESASPGTVVENRTEIVEDLGGGWERVQVFLDLNPRPEWETVHFVLSASGAEPAAIDNLILSAGMAHPPMNERVMVAPSAREACMPQPEPPEPPVNVVWQDGFDSYPLGSDVHGQGGWKGWGNDPTLGAIVTDDQSHSAPQSIDVAAGTDIVHEYSNRDSGKWAFSTWQYIPSDFVGGGGDTPGSFFVLMNRYSDSGPWEEQDWSAQLDFDSNDGMLKVYYGDGMNTVDVPYIPDEWVEINVVIDLDIDSCTISYNGAFLAEYSWTGGATGIGGGALDIAAVDLYANNSTSIYYDDLKLEPLRP